MSLQPGLPETLRVVETPEPVPGKDEVIIAVKAAGVNFPDTLIIDDKYQFKPERPFAPGGEIAGTVECVGANVSGLRPGQRVTASLAWGGYAETVKASAARVRPFPDAMSFDEASSFCMTYGTAQFALKDRGLLKAGETVLVLGAAGGVGVAAIDLAKAMGARAIAAVSSPAKAAFAKDAGADEVVIYPASGLSKRASKQLAEGFRAGCGGGADIVYDAVGGDYCEPALRALNWGAAAARDPERDEQSVQQLFGLYKEGKIRPRISDRFKLEDAGAAIRALPDRKATGKLVVMIS